MHAWAADVAERLIGRSCALEQIVTDLVHPVEARNTRTINLWAWAANPSTIPKRVWLGFTNRAKNPQSEELFVQDKPPEHWQRGVRHPVLFHLEEVHDYTVAGVVLTEETTCQPTRRKLPPWSLGVMDGEPTPARAFETFQHHLSPRNLSVHARLGQDGIRGDRMAGVVGIATTVTTVATTTMKMQQLTKEDEVTVGNEGIARIGTKPMKTTTQTLVARDGGSGITMMMTATTVKAAGAGTWLEASSMGKEASSCCQELTVLEKSQDPVQTGNEVWSPKAIIPAKRVFERILQDLALVHGDLEPMTTELDGVAVSMLQDTGAGDIGHMDHTAVDDDEEAASNAELPPLDTVVVNMTTVIDQATRDVDTLPPKPNDSTLPKLIMQVNELFVPPPKPIISTSLATTGAVVGRRTKPRLLPSSTNTRRSARLARQPALTAMERCQRVLLRRMGLMQKEDDAAAVQEVLAQYVAMFDGPCRRTLSQHSRRSSASTTTTATTPQTPSFESWVKGSQMRSRRWRRLLPDTHRGRKWEIDNSMHYLKDAFLRHIRRLKPSPGEGWLLLGDFNMIYRARDKNNTNLNLAHMNRFKSTLDHCELKEIHLQNQKFTWSNEWLRPTLVKLARCFCNETWNLAFPNHVLYALPTGPSDHCPLILSNAAVHDKPRTFKFENFWTKILGFKDVVADAWNKQTAHTEPIHRLNHKLQTTARCLRKWSRGICLEAKLQFYMALDVIQRLDTAQERRELTAAERRLRASLKNRLLGLATIERACKRQASRITNIREGDANTKFFHLKANTRRRKNNIQILRKENAWATSHEDKEAVIHDYFAAIMGWPEPRTCDLNWQEFHTPPVDLSHLDEPFTEEEILKAIKQMLTDKAPGPDGYTMNFFRVCWAIIKEDVVAVFNVINNLRCASLNMLNSANIVLIPKKGAEEVADFRPISLIHSIAKILSKLLALRLRPHMHSLVSISQSAFIKGRSIHDNFKYVRNLARRYHKTRRPMLLFKLDITKAFDSVRWDYLLSLLQHQGFPQKWRDWISAILSTSTSQVLLNGISGERIQHGRGLRQGDPLSPLLFIMAIDPLQWILSKATQLNAITKLRDRVACLRISMYADDAVVFMNLVKNDVQTFTSILKSFEEATGLITNMHKSQVAAIRCHNIDIDHLLEGVPAMRAQFPLKYLGLPLVLGRTRKTDTQQILDKIMARITGWRGKNLGPVGRSVLVKSVLTAQPIYLLAALKITKESLNQIDAKRRRFLWAGTGDITGGKCKVNWERTCMPIKQGGLGMLNLEKFTRALRLRWLWHEWSDPAKPWVGMDTPCDEMDRALFEAVSKITIGDGNTIRFWNSAWLMGRRPKDVMPLVYAASSKRKKTLREGITNNVWIADLKLNNSTSLTVELINQLIDLWGATQEILLQQGVLDQITWKLSDHGEYSTSSAYKVQCLGSTDSKLNSLIWKAWAPPKCKFYAWLVTQIECGPQIGLRLEVSQTTEYAPFVARRTSQQNTSLPIADTPKESRR
ncbi:uncharacterized protein LOC107305206 [Oryza brachyantha]|uniref:uncharacterized protein LOC107305206 n=1 Tax=Oryza brachyantha TaxID=4533 RepID=UPI001ADB2F06|nr:uncharacterized protein LOC107305206 [Oryza brachyantha]